MKKKVAHFVLHGSDFTRLARDFLLSEEPAKAWRMVAKGLEGPDAHEAALGILQGNKRLTGDSTDGLDLVDEDPETRTGFRETVAYIYAGRIKLDGRWYRPVAEAVRRSNGPPYLASNERLVDTVHIFEACGERPFWWDENRTVIEALEEFQAAGRKLEKRGPDLRLREDEDTIDVDVEADEEERRAWGIERRPPKTDKLTDFQAAILAQAAGDLFTLAWDGGSAEVPRAPFLHWAFRGCVYDQIPPWTPICPSGMKLTFDDPNHTDWLVGAGLPLEDAYRGQVYDAAIRKIGDFQEELAEFKATVLVAGLLAVGPVVHPAPGSVVPIGSIVVLPNLSPRYYEATVGAVAVISETGGKMAHLAQVGAEKSLPILIVGDARTRYPAGSKVRVDSARGIVEIL